MEKYFESILHNIDDKNDTQKIKGSSINTTFNVVSSFDGFGINQFKLFIEKKRITCLNLRTLVREAGEKVMKSLPNEYITTDEKFELVANMTIESIENIYENPMVILVDYVGIDELYQLSAIILMLKKNAKNINWYHLNFDMDVMFNILKEEQKARATHSLTERFMELLPVFYKKQDKKIEHSILLDKKEFKYKLMNFKKWFENELSLNTAVTNLFNQFDSLDDDKAIYIHFRISPESFVKFIDINSDNANNLDDAFSKIDIN